MEDYRAQEGSYLTRGQLYSEVLLEPFSHILGDLERSEHRCYRENLCLVTERTRTESVFPGGEPPVTRGAYPYYRGASGTTGLQTRVRIAPLRMRGNSLGRPIPAPCSEGHQRNL